MIVDCDDTMMVDEMSTSQHISTSHYTILDVSCTATQTDIKKSYKKLAREYHPDKRPGCEENFRQVCEAYATLSDESKRREYDEWLRGGNTPPRQEIIVPAPQPAPQPEIIFISCDGTKVPFSLETARMCDIAVPFFKEDTDDDDDDDDEALVPAISVPITGRPPIPVPIRGTTLQKVAIFCERYLTYPNDRPNIVKPFTSYHIEEIVPEWYADFVTNISLGTLFDLMKAANFMGIEPLQELVLLPVSMLIEKRAYAGDLPSLFNKLEVGREGKDRKEKISDNDAGTEKTKKNATNIGEVGDVAQDKSNNKRRKKRKGLSKRMRDRLKKSRQSLM